MTPFRSQVLKLMVCIAGLFLSFACSYALDDTLDQRNNSILQAEQFGLKGLLLAQKTSAHYDSAFFYLEKAKSIFEKEKLWKQYVNSCNLIGMTYYHLSQYDKAATYYEKALDEGNPEIEKLQEAARMIKLALATCYQKKGTIDPMQHDQEWLYHATFAAYPGVYDQVKIHDHLDAMASRYNTTYFDSLKRFFHAYENQNYDTASFYFHINNYISFPDLDFLSRPHIHIVQTLGQHYFQQGNYNQAIITYRKFLLQLFDYIARFRMEISWSYSDLGKCYMQKGDYENALNYLHKALDIRLILTTKIDDSQNVWWSFNNIGACHEKLGNYQKALSYHQRALKIRDKFAKEFGKAFAKVRNIEFDSYIGSSYNRMGYCYFKLQSYDSAKVYFHKALKNWEEVVNMYQSKDYTDKVYFAPFIYRQDKADCLNNLGELYTIISDKKQAFTYLKKALNWRLSFSNKKNAEVAKNYHSLAQYFMKQNNWEAAFDQLQSAMMAVIENFEGKDIYTNPSLELLQPENNQVRSRLTLLETLRLKAQCFQKLGTEKNGHKNLQRALETYQLAAHLVDIIRVSYPTESAKLTLTQNTVSLYEGAINTAFQLYQLTQQATYLEDAFFFMEKNKAAILLEALQDSEAKQFANIPKEVLQKEKTSKIRRTQLQQLKFEGNMEHIPSLRNEWVELNQEYEDLLQDLEQHYPEYYQLKYNTEVASLKDIQNYLTDSKDVMLEYFVGDTTLYIFRITKEEVQLHRRPKPDNLEEVITSFRSHLTYDGFEAFLEASDSLKPLIFKTFVQNGHQLYQWLIKDFLPQKKPSRTGRVIVIPDGMIGYLPLEVMPQTATVNSDSDYDYSALEYLIKDYTIAYAYSATFLIEATSQSDTSITSPTALKPFAGFAPVYNFETLAQLDTSDSKSLAMMVRNGYLSPLPRAQEEVNTISNLLHGDAFTGKKASEHNFKTHSSEYSILHLAMHAVTDDANPLNSRLVFNQVDNGSEDNYLKVSELYNMELNANLVVLSACETGYGQLVRGEGIMSLSRAFAYAGCSAILMSLWSCDDASTSEVMQRFYQELKAGRKKDEALRTAKLHFLENSDHGYFDSHPFYWAAFVPMGDMEPVDIKEKRSHTIIWIIVSLILLSVIGMLIRRRKKLLAFSC